MLRLLADENFNRDIVRGLVNRQAEMDIVRVQDVGLASAEDPAILEWAAENDRIVLTHDRATMKDYAGERLRAGEEMPGMLLFDPNFPVGAAIDELVMVCECCQQDEWNDRIVFLPI
jgi:predicted nuclease of predicted toxin-antitoxin system